MLPAISATISDGLDLESKVESRVIGGKYSNDTFKLGADFVRAARYMVANRTEEVARSIHLTRIAATIVWSGIVVEITGLLKPKDATRKYELPLFIRHFDKLYYTGDILQRIRDTKTLDIIKSNFVTQSYLRKFTQNKVSINKQTMSKLYKKKKKYINRIKKGTATGSRLVTYSGLYADKAVKEYLKEITSSLEKNLQINAQIRIVLNNFKPFGEK